VTEAATKGLEQAATDQGVKTEVSEYFPQILAFLPIQGQILEVPPTLPGIGNDRTVLAECFRMASEGKKLSDVVLAGHDLAVVIEKMDEKGPRSVVYEKALTERDRANLMQILVFKVGSVGIRTLRVDSVVARDDVKVAEGASPEFSLPRTSRMGMPAGGDDGGGDY
jgi:hypothetical protein